MLTVQVGVATVLRARDVKSADTPVSVPGSTAPLDRRGITYVPDFVADAGGVLQLHAERAGWDAGRLGLALDAAGTRTADLLEEPDATHSLPLEVAEHWASARPRRTVTIPD